MEWSSILVRFQVALTALLPVSTTAARWSGPRSMATDSCTLSYGRPMGRLPKMWSGSIEQAGCCSPDGGRWMVRSAALGATAGRQGAGRIEVNALLAPVGVHGGGVRLPRNGYGTRLSSYSPR